KVNKRALATGYGIVALVIRIMINLSLLMPDRLNLTTYHVKEMIPMPALRPLPEPIKTEVPKIKPKLLPAVKLPVFETPKLVVPKEVRRQVEKVVEAPKVVVNNFAPPQIKMTPGGARPQLV